MYAILDQYLPPSFFDKDEQVKTTLETSGDLKTTLETSGEDIKNTPETSGEDLNKNYTRNE
jgi:hypothetical protein